MMKNRAPHGFPAQQEKLRVLLAMVHRQRFDAF
jgi:sulfur relay (sulfurtransferase) DsrF/TusC family protein